MIARVNFMRHKVNILRYFHISHLYHIDCSDSIVAIKKQELHSFT